MSTLVIRRRPRRATPMRSLRVAWDADEAAPVGPLPFRLDHDHDGRPTWVAAAASAGLHAGLLASLAWIAAPPTEDDPAPPPIRRLPEADLVTGPRRVAPPRLPGIAPTPPVHAAPALPRPSAPFRAAPPARRAPHTIVEPARPAAPGPRIGIQAPPRAAWAEPAPSAVDPLRPAPFTSAGGEVRDVPAAVAGRGPSDVPTASSSGSVAGLGGEARHEPLSLGSIEGDAASGEAWQVDASIGDWGAVGGEAGGAGGALAPCLERPAVRDYLGRVRRRTIQHWNPPPASRTPDPVRLRFAIDERGSATEARFLDAPDAAVGASIVEALKTASPFDVMTAPERCLAGQPLVGRFLAEDAVQ